MSSGYPMKLWINQRQQVLQGSILTVAPGPKELSDMPGRGYSCHRLPISILKRPDYWQGVYPSVDGIKRDLENLSLIWWFFPVVCAFPCEGRRNGDEDTVGIAGDVGGGSY
jgi:hypothetical protein